MTRIVASLVERSIAGVSDSSRLASRSGADLVEVRFDLMNGLTEQRIQEARSAVHGPAIATVRSAAEGGRSKLKGRRRKALLDASISSGYALVDLELRTDRATLQQLRKVRSGPDVVCSAHFRKPVSREMVEATLTDTCRFGDIGKVAMTCEHSGHALMLASVARKFTGLGETFALIGMGEQGKITRVCAEGMGSALAYSCLPGRPAAPGQLDVASQRLMSDGAVVLGLIGHPVSHSISAPMQEAALRKAGMCGCYVLLDLPKDSLTREAVETLEAIGFAGVNITIPHKRAAAQLCDRLSKAASSTGAVNTVKFEKGRVVGENTDCYGFSKLIEGKIHLSEDTRALVLGAGGAARAVAHVLAGEGARMTIAARKLPQAIEVADAFGGSATKLSSLRSAGADYDLIVNCTPLGTKGGTSKNPLPGNLLRRGSVFVDLVYNPPLTPAMRATTAKGGRAHGGLEMLVHQGARAFQLWTGKKPDVAAMRRAARRALR